LYILRLLYFRLFCYFLYNHNQICNNHKTIKLGYNYHGYNDHGYNDHGYNEFMSISMTDCKWRLENSIITVHTT